MLTSALASDMRNKRHGVRRVAPGLYAVKRQAPWNTWVDDAIGFAMAVIGALIFLAVYRSVVR
jgi:hypothetical protein